MEGEMNRFVMERGGEMGGRPIKKSVKFITNAEMIAGRIARKCIGGHKQIQLVNKRVKPAEVYPEDLCKEILRGLRDLMEIDGRLNNTGGGMRVCR